MAATALLELESNIGHCRTLRRISVYHQLCSCSCLMRLGQALAFLSHLPQGVLHRKAYARLIASSFTGFRN
jgi:hypothetical protein